MKTLYILVFALASAAFGQNPYVKATTHNGTVTLKNTSGQAIVLLVGNVTLNGKTLPHPDGTVSQFHHEFFFDQGGWPAGDTMDWETKFTGEPRGFDYSVVPTFIQFDDGTTWGTRNAKADSVIASRALKIAYLHKLLDSASFASALNEQPANAAEADAQIRIRGWLDLGLGIPATITKAKQLLATGTARQNSGKF